jgi:hypothetical protein
VNELTVPNDVVDNDIEINVFVSACDDFEVACPTDYYLGSLAFSPPITPQSLEIDNVPVAAPPVLNTMGPKSPVDSLINRIHMGEAVVSFRTLLKRYNLHEVMTYYTESFLGNYAIVVFRRNMFPYTPGYTPFTNAQNNIIEDLPTGGYAYAKMTLLNYLQRGYAAWRGSIRYTVDTTPNIWSAADSTYASLIDSTWSVSRINPYAALGDSIPTNEVIYPDLSSLATLKYDVLRTNEYSSGISGVTRWNTKVNPVQSFEIPFYSDKRFAPARRNTRWVLPDYDQQSFELLGSCVPGLDPVQVYSYVAAGEDFTLAFYLSPPVLYYQQLPSP